MNMNTKISINSLPSCLNQLQDNIHTLHLYISNYNQHILLNEMYEYLLKMYDSISENLIVKGITSETMLYRNSETIEELIAFISSLNNDIQELKVDRSLNNLLDDLSQNLYHFEYLLKMTI